MHVTTNSRRWLGPKLSEEPYSGEDRDLLLTVARQAGMAIENARLVEVAKREAQHAKELEIGYTPPLWDPTLVDDIVPVKTDDAKNMARRMAREEALFAGTSSGANVVAALRLAERLGPQAKVVTLMADSGLKYLSTDVYGTR